MNLKALLNSVLLCVVPVASQYTVDTIPDITFIRSMTLVDDALYLNDCDRGEAGSVTVVRNGLKTRLWTGNYSENGPSDFTSMDGKVYYCFNDLSTGRYGPFFNSLWVTDGVSGSSKLIDERVGEPTAIGSNLFFRKYEPTTGYELWNYTESGGAHIVTDLWPGSSHSYPTNITVFNNRLYFKAKLPSYGYELWTSDGTAAGTYLVKDIWPGPRDCSATYPMNLDGVQFSIIEPEQKFIECNGAFYFLADDSIHGYELWRSDGTAAGTFLVKDVHSGRGHAFNKADWQNPPLFCVLNNELYFVPDDGVHGKELWKTDGTNAGTYMLKDIGSGSAHAGITELEANNGFVYFAADNGINGLELWRTDGTSAGTELFMDFQPQIISTSNSNPRDLTTHTDGKLYLVTKCVVRDTFCDDGGLCVPYDSITVSMYRTDGTVAGTEKVLDFPTDEISDTSHTLLSSPQGLFFRRVGFYHRLCLLRSADLPVVFVSTPLSNATVGTQYVYDIQVNDPEGQPITIAATGLPPWMTLIDNGNGTARLSGTPLIAGDFSIILSASVSGTSATVTQSFTVQARDPVIDASLSVYSYEEMRNDPNQSNPRVYVENTGSTDVSDFVVEYYFRVENGKTPVMEPYYIPDCSVSLVSLGDDYYKIVYDFTGKTIVPGQILPNISGTVVGIHHSDYSSWDKTNDYSNNLSSTFIENDHICIYLDGTRIFGTPPLNNAAPVAIAGSNITVVDVGGDGENILLDGSASYDTDGHIISYDWFVNGSLAASGRTGYVTLFPGVHTVFLHVADDDSAVATDTVIITVLDDVHSIVFSMSSDPVQINNPVILRYTIPAALDGAIVRYTVQRQWDVISGTLVGRQGTFTYYFWEWTKSFFGGSGPWPMNIEVNGVLVDTKQVRFAY